MRKNIIPALVLLLLPWLASVASACTCGGQSPCQAYADAAVVFVGRVTQTGLKSIPSSALENVMSTTFTSADIQSAQFKVEEPFLGVTVAEIEILGQGTTCDFEFKPGEQYLVFASKNSKTGTFHTNICSGTAPLAESNDTLTYLRSLVKQQGATFSGEVVREVYGKDGLGVEPIAKAEVILINGKDQFRGLSDAGGKFEIRGIKPGRYRVHTNPATNHSRIDAMAEDPRKEWDLDVPAHGCVQTWFVARPGGEISGRVGDESGVVGGDIYPQILSADEKEVTDTSYRSQNLTEWKTFKFSFLPPGRYYLGFNLRGGPSIETPYPEFYYPGVEDKSKAEVITLAEGQKISDIYLRRPLRLAERMIEGVAVWPDGKPYVENCGISLTNPRTGYREGNCVSTDAEGRFKIKGIEGQTYNLGATLVGPGRGLITSKPLVVKVEKDNSPFKLVVEKP